MKSNSRYPYTYAWDKFREHHPEMELSRADVSRIMHFVADVLHIDAEQIAVAIIHKHVENSEEVRQRAIDHALKKLRE